MDSLTRMTDRFLQAAEVEAQTPITAGARPVNFLRFPLSKPTTELLALAKLVELRRRSLGLTPLQLAERASVSCLELLRLEEGVLEPRVLEKLPVIASALSLRESSLLELAGVKADLAGVIPQAAQIFVNRTGSAAPNQAESEAMEEFVRVLESA